MRKQDNLPTNPVYQDTLYRIMIRMGRDEVFRYRIYQKKFAFWIFPYWEDIDDWDLGWDTKKDAMNHIDYIRKENKKYDERKKKIKQYRKKGY